MSFSRKILKSLFLIWLFLGIGVYVILRMNYYPPVLMYHAIDENWDKSRLSVSPRAFLKQMTFLREKGYRVVSLEEMADFVRKNQRPPSKSAAITFDDGFENNFLYAYPVFKKLNFPAVIFVVTDWIGKEGYLTAGQVKEMSDNGIEIGSHTKSHAWLPSLDVESLYREIYDSKKELEEITGREVRYFSYPLGGFNEKVIQMVKEAGYALAAATNPGKKGGKDDKFAVKRLKIAMTSDNLLVFALEISGYYTFLKEIRDDD